jgi:hypothetical protein
VRRRGFLAAGALFPLVGPLAGCEQAVMAERAVVASDDRHLWAGPDGPLGRGFCLTLVRGLRPSLVVPAIGGKSHEMVFWAQIVGPGDGEKGSRRYFTGIANLGRWTLLLEDGDGGLGMDTVLMERLSAETEVVAYRCDTTRKGPLRVYRDGRLETDVTDPTETAITSIEAWTGIALTGAMLESKRYLLVTVPKA